MPSDDQQLLRERLNTLLREHSQSDIARKTDTGVMNVNRYARKTRIPGDFCCALVKGLGVNPSWLLAGEGSPWLSDVGQDVGQTASNLLDMVQAMNRMMRAKMGSLAGKQAGKTLRELNDAIGVYEKLKVDLKERLGPVFDQVLDAFNRAYTARKLEEAAPLRDAAAQIARLCDDPKRSLEFSMLNAAYEQVLGHREASLAIQRSVLWRTLADDTTSPEDRLSRSVNLVMQLFNSGHDREGLKLAKAMLALEDEPRSSPDYLRLVYLRRLLECRLIDIGKYLGLAVRAHQALYRTGLSREFVDNIGIPLQGLRILAGVDSLEDMLNRRFTRGNSRNNARRALVMMRHVCVLEDPELLQLAMTRFGSAIKILPDDVTHKADIHGNFVLRALKSGNPKIIEECRKAFEPLADSWKAQGAAGAIRLPAILGQLARITKQEAQGRRYYREVESLLTVHGDPGAHHLALAMHHRNGMLLWPESVSAEHKQARAFFRDHIKRGYEWYREVMPTDLISLPGRRAK